MKLLGIAIGSSVLYAGAAFAAAPPSGVDAPIVVKQAVLTNGSAGAQPLADGATVPNGPLYLRLTLGGDQAAVDQMRAAGRLALEVHWDGPGRPLTTELPIGGPGMADLFESSVRRTGSFEWHSWAEKTAVPAGSWTVSLSYPDGAPLLCGAAPCRFTVNVGGANPGAAQPAADVEAPSGSSVPPQPRPPAIWFNPK